MCFYIRNEMESLWKEWLMLGIEYIKFINGFTLNVTVLFPIFLSVLVLAVLYLFSKEIVKLYLQIFGLKLCFKV